ncbi:MAG: transposase [Actinobacteria bacterium]|nr:transposase [Actinomycetota bacterium]
MAGIIPSDRSSAEHTRRRHISKQGSRWLRWELWRLPLKLSGTRTSDRTSITSPDGEARGSLRSPWPGDWSPLCYYALRD